MLQDDGVAGVGIRRGKVVAYGAGRAGDDVLEHVEELCGVLEGVARALQDVHAHVVIEGLGQGQSFVAGGRDDEVFRQRPVDDGRMGQGLLGVGAHTACKGSSGRPLNLAGLLVHLDAVVGILGNQERGLGLDFHIDGGGLPF